MKTHYQHQVVLFAEKSEDDFSTPLKIGNLFFNRFGADEEASFEMIGAYALQKSSYKIAFRGHLEYKSFEMERFQKGVDH